MRERTLPSFWHVLLRPSIDINGKEDSAMEYVKATVNVIDMNEEDIIISSGGCTTTANQTEDTCTGGNHSDKYSGCENNGHQNHGGQ